MMNEVRVIRRIRREIRMYKRSLPDITDKGQYATGVIFGLSRGVEIIMAMAKATHETERQWRMQARFFKAGWLLRKIELNCKRLQAGDRGVVIKDLENIIAKSQKGMPCTANMSYRESI